jgi:hypothetical protein
MEEERGMWRWVKVGSEWGVRNEEWSGEFRSGKPNGR